MCGVADWWCIVWRQIERQGSVVGIWILLSQTHAFRSKAYGYGNTIHSCTVPLILHEIIKYLKTNYKTFQLVIFVSFLIIALYKVRISHQNFVLECPKSLLFCHSDRSGLTSIWSVRKCVFFFFVLMFRMLLKTVEPSRNQPRVLKNR
jgi:hypothetical protein